MEIKSLPKCSIMCDFCGKDPEDCNYVDPHWLCSRPLAEWVKCGPAALMALGLDPEDIDWEIITPAPETKKPIAIAVQSCGFCGGKVNAANLQCLSCGEFPPDCED